MIKLCVLLTFAEHLLQPQLLLILHVLHLLAAGLAVLSAAVLHAGAAGGGDPEAGHPAGLSRLQPHGAGQLLPAAVEEPAGVREEKLEEPELVDRSQNHDGLTGSQLQNKTISTRCK